MTKLDVPVEADAGCQPNSQPSLLLRQVGLTKNSISIARIARAEDKVPGVISLRKIAGRARERQVDSWYRRYGEVGKDSLRSFGPQIERGGRCLRPTHEGSDIRIELPRLGQFATAVGAAHVTTHLIGSE